MNDSEPKEILLVEDNPDHAKLVEISLAKHRVPNHIHHVTDGEAALDFLYRRGIYSDLPLNPLPHVILLDLRLPKVDGLEVLRIIKRDERLRNIPVIVLTTSDSETDIRQAYMNYTSSYLVKPVDFDELANMMNDLGSYWLPWNRKPH